MAKIDETYHRLLSRILNKGFTYEDPNRRGTNRIQIPSYEFKHDFKDGFPAITTKNLWWKGIVTELIWFLRGNTAPKFLIDNGVDIWNKDGANFLNRQTGINLSPERYKELVKTDQIVGDLGRIYGAQWRNWQPKEDSFYEEEGLDQFKNLIDKLRSTPMATNHIVTAWNPAELDNMALPPCHWSFEVLAEPLDREEYYYKVICKGKPTGAVMVTDSFLDELLIPKHQFTLKWHQRSCDSFLGIPFNIASYALLAQIIGKMTSMVPKGIIGDLSNVHIYEPHLEMVNEQLIRDTGKYKNCELELNETTVRILEGDKSLNEKISFLLPQDFILQGYESYPKIKAEMLAYKK